MASRVESGARFCARSMSSSAASNCRSRVSAVARASQAAGSRGFFRTEALSLSIPVPAITGRSSSPPGYPVPLVAPNRCPAPRHPNRAIAGWPEHGARAPRHCRSRRSTRSDDSAPPSTAQARRAQRRVFFQTAFRSSMLPDGCCRNQADQWSIAVSLRPCVHSRSPMRCAMPGGVGETFRRHCSSAASKPR